MKIYDNYKKSLTELLKKQDIYFANEIKANILVAIFMNVVTLVMSLFLILSSFNLTLIPLNQAAILFSIVFILFGVPSVICLIKKGNDKRWKYVLLLNISLYGLVLCFLLPLYTIIFVLLPIVLSSCYFDKKFVFFISTFLLVLFIPISIGSIFIGKVNLNFVNFEDINQSKIILETFSFYDVADKKYYILHFFSSCFTPGFLGILLFGTITYLVSKKGYTIIYEKANVIAKSKYIASELEIAHNIQTNVLPKAFPIFPEHEELEVYGVMFPAKEVGGDFFDTFNIDESHIAIVISDVSGKGIPSALFMMITKTLIKNDLQNHLSLSETVSHVNRALCEGNEQGLFATAWIGILDINTGELKYINAGHNPPLIKLGKRDFFYLIDERRSPVLAAFEYSKFREYYVTLREGDKIILYTDGVTESTNENNELYGENRLLKFANKHIDDDVYRIVDFIVQDALNFSGNLPQFDDITILALDYSKHPHRSFKQFLLSKAEIDNCTNFISSQVEKYTDEIKNVTVFTLCVEEIYAFYLEKTNKNNKQRVVTEVKFNPSDKTIHVCFVISGEKFNPWNMKDINPNQIQNEKRWGGLGIYIVKKMMDEVNYEYIHSYNYIEIIKKI